jgi:Fe-S oxidoreductase
MRETMELCISCKGCKRECPTGVDMARMKIEFLNHYKRRHGLGLRDRLVAYLPRYAATAANFAWLLNLRNRIPALAKLGERVTGFSAKRKLPEWHNEPYRDGASPSKKPPLPLSEGRGNGAQPVLLLVDTFNRWFEPENARAAERVLRRAGYDVIAAPAPDNGRPLCCGRTFLAAGLVEEAKKEARRTLDALLPFLEAKIPIVGLEPSCLLTLRDEFTVLLPGPETTLLAKRAMLLEEFIVEERAAGRFKLAIRELPEREALIHGHCHQKAFNTVGALETALGFVPGLKVKTFESTCCGMAGAFGYEAEHYEISLRIGELGVLPTMRAAAPDTLLIAGGTSCRHQIADGAARKTVHFACILDRATAPAEETEPS